jgi:glutamate formiminotransferase/formiminotetrahydrofolate cyclodeaminase
MLIDETLEDFTRRLASSSPTPGGGSTAAVAGALGMGLLRKVALITGGKAAFAHCRELTGRVAGEADALGRDFLAWVDGDTAAYRDFIAAGRLPRNTEEEGAAYRRRLSGCLRACVDLPRGILRAAVRGLRLGKDLAADYYTGTASDLGLAAVSLQTAAQGSQLTILINLKALAGEEPGFAAERRREGEALLEEAEALAGEIYARVRKALP